MMHPAIATFLRLCALATAVAVAASLLAQTAKAQTLLQDQGIQQNTTSILASGSDRAGELVVPRGKSQIIRLDRPVTDILVGDPEIADVMALSTRSIYVLGKAAGATNLTIYGRNRELLAVIDLIVGHDAAGLRNKLNELLPGEPIEVRAVNDSLVLSGAVSSSGKLDRALAIAERYAPQKVTNLMSVTGSQQVMVSVRIAEISRRLTRQLGINPSFLFGNDLFINALDPISATAKAAAVFDVQEGDVTVDGFIDALEQKGAIKVLAEPNLIALSGDTATFLAGGEFPIPVAQDSGDNGPVSITVEFKEFGVALEFTPTVLDNDLISLAVAPEVSEIDRNNAVTVSGINIPGLTTRRASTVVELRDGESFAIAGLIQSNFSDQVRQVPGLGDLPVLGALLRSVEFQQNETELVIIVTPHLVRPAAPGQLAAPTDTFAAPSMADLLFLGQVEGAPTSSGVATGETADTGPRRHPSQAAATLGAHPEGGLTGSYGHILK